MVRHYTRKSVKGLTPAASIKSAVDAVLNGSAVNTAAKQFGVNRMTLKRHVKLRRDNPETSFVAKYAHRQVFSGDDEKMLAEYLLLASKMHYGLSTKQTRRLAYNFAIANSKNVPQSWKTNECAGEDWLCSLMKRRPELSLRTPEATSLARATAFNRHNVKEFFDNLSDVRRRYQYSPQDIYNVDETGLTTVQKPAKVIAGKGARQVGRITSALVTACCAVNSLGNSIPPFFVFPRVNFKSHMITGGPTGCVGVASSSGWMTAENFVVWMNHFILHSGSSKTKPVLLLLDNHESHITVECLDLAKNNGITMLTFPPHCSHKLQLLDWSVYGPLKRYYNASCDSWLMSNPRPMTIYDIASVVNIPFSQAFTQSNIKAGFSLSGIEPFNSDVFHDDEFLGASVTDRPLPSTLSNNQLNRPLPSTLSNSHSNEPLSLNPSDNRPNEPLNPTPPNNHTIQPLSRPTTPPNNQLDQPSTNLTGQVIR